MTSAFLRIAKSINLESFTGIISAWKTQFFKIFDFPCMVTSFFGCCFVSRYGYLELATKDNKASHKSFMSQHPSVTFTLNCLGPLLPIISIYHCHGVTFHWLPLTTYANINLIINMNHVEDIGVEIDH